MKKTNGIGVRLYDHFNGQSGNVGLFNYIKSIDVKFTYINFDILKDFWKLSIENLESYFILDFLKYHGAYPICNNKTGFPELPKKYFNINWRRHADDIKTKTIDFTGLFQVAGNRISWIWSDDTQTT